MKTEKNTISKSLLEADQLCHQNLSKHKVVSLESLEAYKKVAELNYFPFRICDYTTVLTDNVFYVEEIIKDPDPPIVGSIEASVNHDPVQNVAQPYVSIGGGLGATNTVTVKTEYRFSHNPADVGDLCINPWVLMSGWWLYWTWGNCAGEGQGSGSFHVKVRTRVIQHGADIATREHTVTEFTSSSGGDDEGAVDYDSDQDGGTYIRVNLTSTDTVTIAVETEVRASVTDFGRAIVDMQSGQRGFFTMVPEVRVGPTKSWWYVFQHAQHI